MSVPYPHDKLPVPVRDGFSAGALNAYKTHEMDDGHKFHRRRFKRHALKFALSFEFTYAQFAFFEAFVKYDLRGGVEWMEIDFNGKGETHSVKMTKRYEVTYAEDTNRWRVTVECMSLTAASVYRPIGFIAQWPAELPEPEANQYSIKAESALTVSSTPDAGAMQSRVRFQTVWTSFSCKWLLNPAELDTLKRFLAEDIAHGHACFAAPFANGSGTKRVRARFITYPKWTPLNAIYQVSAELETSQAPLLSQAAYEALKG